MSRLEEVLALCFKETGLGYEIVNKIIVVKEIKYNETHDGSQQQDTITIRGVVYNESGQPLSSTNVTIKETGRGTITNAQGEFKLTAVQVNSTS